VAHGGVLAPSQAAVSRAVLQALVFLGRHQDAEIGAVLQLPQGESASAAPADADADSLGPKLGALPTRRHFESPRWGNAPFVYDFSAAAALGDLVGHDAARVRRFSEALMAPLMAGDGPHRRVVRLGWGRYAEDRVIYTSEHFTGANARTVHLGVDLEAPAGAPVYAPLGGRIHSVGVNDAPLDYGPTVILEHTLSVTRQGRRDGDATTSTAPPQRLTFFTLYGHLSRSSLESSDTPAGAPRLVPGQAIARGEVLGWLGDESVNGGWPPHLHFQVNTELNHGGWRGDYPGVCARGDWPAYRALCPDPNVLLRCPFVEPVGWADADGGGSVDEGSGALEGDDAIVDVQVL
jgi:murein DD-endopeptidase MepM/ murein hydrolase activator NlpD